MTCTSRSWFAVTAFAWILASVNAELPAPAREILLYAGSAPGSETWNWSERTFTTPRGNIVVQNVVRPVLQFYPADPAKSAGTAVIVAPGGGFTNLMIAYEGVDIARRLNAMGVDAFILKYRLVYVDPAETPTPPGTKPAPAPPVRDASGRIFTGPQTGQNILELTAADGRNAVRWLRTHAAEFGFGPQRIGIIGFSAGGYVSLATVDGPIESRPDFAAIIYGAGPQPPTPTRDSPPLFIAVAADDGGVANSLALFAAWRRANRPAELHVFQMGGHGFRNFGGGADHFMDRLEEWLRANAWLRPASGAK